MLRILIFLCLLTSGLSFGQSRPGTAADTPGSPASRQLSEDAGKTLAPLTVQSGGRSKPVDSFARFNLLACYHKSKMEDIPATQWLAQLILNPDEAYDVKCFRIRNEDLIADLGLKKNAQGHNFFSFNELRLIMDAQTPRIQIINSRKTDDQTLIEQQLVKLYSTVHTYFGISRSFTCLTPELSISNPQLASDLGLPLNQRFSFFQLHQRGKQLRTLVEKMHSSFDQENSYQNDLLELVSQFKDMQEHEQAFQGLALIPASNDPVLDPWLTPWQVLNPKHPITAQEIKFMTELQAVVTALISKQTPKAAKHVDTLRALYPPKIKSLTSAELFYNKLDAFTNSLAFYLLGFLLLCFSWLFAGKQLRWASWSIVFIGLLIHTLGILIRMYIRGRPAPVTNIYESIIFVGFICVFLGLILEFKRRDGLGLIIAIVPGSILHFVGFKYALEGDTMGRLVAVLNSNFWLSTHVVTITIGYGAAAVAGLIATSYLYIRLFKPNNKALLQSISKNFIGATLLALLFSIVGTILGGIWGDQSWGRFWGWDPKENGALLICLWLLVVVHGKWGKQLKELGLATMLSLTNISVLLAWFGVNLLGVGLHSYGFTDGAALNLTLACAAIFLISVIPSMIIYFRDISLRQIQPPSKPDAPNSQNKSARENTKQA